MENMVGYDDSRVAKDALNIAMLHAQAFVRLHSSIYNPECDMPGTYPQIAAF